MRASQVALGKNPPCDAGDSCMGSVPGWEDLLEEEHSNPLQYSCLGNRMDRGGWQAVVHRVTQDSDMTEET